MRVPFKWVAAVLAILTVLGVSVPTVKSIYRGFQARIDQFKTVETLLEEAKSDLSKDMLDLQRAAAAKEELQRKLETLQRQEGNLKQQRAQKGRELTFARQMLKRQGDKIPLGEGVTIRRADVEHDAEVLLARCRELDGRMTQFQGPIAEMTQGLKDVVAALAEARDRLGSDSTKLQKMASEARSYQIRAQIAGLLHKATPEAVLAEQRPFERKMGEVEARFAQLPRGEMVTRVDWATLVAGGRPRNEDLASRIDYYLAGAGPNTK